MEVSIWVVYYERDSEKFVWCDHPSLEDALCAAKALNETRLLKIYGEFKVEEVVIA